MGEWTGGRGDEKSGGVFWLQLIKTLMEIHFLKQNNEQYATIRQAQALP